MGSDWLPELQATNPAGLVHLFQPYASMCGEHPLTALYMLEIIFYPKGEPPLPLR